MEIIKLNVTDSSWHYRLSAEVQLESPKSAGWKQSRYVTEADLWDLCGVPAQWYRFHMKRRLVAIALCLLCCEISLLSQNMPMMSVPKLGKLIPGDTLSVMIFKKADQKLDPSIDLHLTIAVREDGTIVAPLLLERVPAAGLSISQLNTDLQQRYTWYYQHFGPEPSFTPPLVTVGFMGHLGKTALDSLIERIAPTTIR